MESMDYFRGVHETLFEESPWSLHGVSTKTPWRLMESPHGVCGNVWGSVKYSFVSCLSSDDISNTFKDNMAGATLHTPVCTLPTFD